MGGMISSIGYGLMSTLDTTTPVAKWIGYQVLYGVGSGCTTAAVSSIFLKLPNNKPRANLYLPFSPT